MHGLRSSERAYVRYDQQAEVVMTIRRDAPKSIAASETKKMGDGAFDTASAQVQGGAVSGGHHFG